MAIMPCPRPNTVSHLMLSAAGRSEAGFRLASEASVRGQPRYPKLLHQQCELCISIKISKRRNGMPGGHPLILISGILGAFDSLLLGGQTASLHHCFTASFVSSRSLPNPIGQNFFSVLAVVIDKTVQHLAYH